MIKKKQERRLSVCEQLSKALFVSRKGVMGDERSRTENLKGKGLQSLLQSFGPGTQWSEAEEKRDFVTNCPFTYRLKQVHMTMFY